MMVGCEEVRPFAGCVQAEAIALRGSGKKREEAALAVALEVNGDAINPLVEKGTQFTKFSNRSSMSPRASPLTGCDGDHLGDEGMVFENGGEGGFHQPVDLDVLDGASEISEYGKRVDHVAQCAGLYNQHPQAVSSSNSSAAAIASGAVMRSMQR